MRLIDADEYKERISHYPTIKAIAFKELRYVKTIDAEPIRHGRWIEEKSIGDCCYKCSECGFIRDAYLLEIEDYCPQCGAKMNAPTQKSVGKALKALEVTK